MSRLVTHIWAVLEKVFEPVRKAVDMINELEPDYVFFTGDMVNNHADEAIPWVNIFKEIKAKEGKYSVFGNHDYADYGITSRNSEKTVLNA